MPGPAQNYEETNHHCRKYLKMIILHNFEQFSNTQSSRKEKPLGTQLCVALLSFHTILI